MKHLISVLLFLVWIGSIAEAGEDPVERLFMEGTDIEGSLDKPHVVYIIPWEENPGLNPDDILYRRSFLPEILEPVDRDRYYQEFKAQSRNP